MYIKKGRPTVARVMIPCCACSVPVARRASDLARRREVDGQLRVFCSKLCSDRIARKPRRGLNKLCQQCGTGFYVQQCFKNQKFCSKKCHDVSQTKPRVERVCEVCDVPFSLRPSTAETNAGRFCSRKCMGIGSIARPAGYDHNGRPALIDGFGYVWVWQPDHPKAFHGRVKEHRLVMEKVLGRYLTIDEQVDHINRVKHDNQPENLQMLSASEHGTKTNADIARDMAELAEYRKRFGSLAA